ncbi:MAG TPA: hypothetical protein VGB55_03605 [Tepidisphaeraceae bacterium]
MRTYYETEAAVARPLPPALADAPAYRRVWKWLDGNDRLILELASHGVSHRLIGRAVNLSGGTITRRLAMLHRIITSPDTQCLTSPACPLSDEMRQVILLKHLSHRSIPQISAAVGITQGRVRYHIRYARGVVRGHTVRSQLLDRV